MEALEIRFPGRMPMTTGMASVNSLLSGDGTLHRPMRARGFWNDLPLEEERIPLPPMKPHYGHKEADFNTVGWLNLSELGLFLGITYAVIGGTHLAIMMMHWTHH